MDRPSRVWSGRCTECAGMAVTRDPRKHQCRHARNFESRRSGIALGEIAHQRVMGVVQRKIRREEWTAGDKIVLGLPSRRRAGDQSVMKVSSHLVDIGVKVELNTSCARHP